MKRLFLLSLVIIFGASYIVFANTISDSTKTIKIEKEIKKTQVEAVTTATPKPQENQVVITGTLLCTSCDLKKQKGAKSQCSSYGCPFAIKTKNVRNYKGQLLKNYVGKIYQILVNDNSSALVQKDYKGKEVIVVGKVYLEENVIEVDFVKLAPVKKVYTCSMCGGEFDKSGKCPKCNMELIEKK